MRNFNLLPKKNVEFFFCGKQEGTYKHIRCTKLSSFLWFASIMSLLITLHSTFFFFFTVWWFWMSLSPIFMLSLTTSYIFLCVWLNFLMEAKCIIVLTLYFAYHFFSAFLVIFKDLKCWFFGRDWLYFSSSFISCTFTILDLCIRNWLKLCYVDQAMKDNGNEVF